ncbi:MAG: Fe-S cluster assembly protein SufD [Rhodospirillales bacterium]|nr:Fe-S cluster assembly protein SufD [Rhodospirillales bacterium]MCB9995816.1 Fe-S cluster assembly protein SufD [Rhodospirillales bacterium]
MTAAAQNPLIFPEKNRYKPETGERFAALFKADLALQDGPAWLKALRYSALTGLERRGLPTARLERWKYTNFASIVDQFTAAPVPADLREVDPDNLVERLVDNLSNPQEWLEEILSEQDENMARYGDMMLWDLNSLFLKDGLVVDVPAGKAVDKAVEVNFSISDGTAAMPRLVIRLGEGAELSLIERHNAIGKSWHNGVTQIIVGPNARLRHYRIQDSHPEAVHSQNTAVRLMRDASYESFTLTTGAGMSRNQIHAFIEDTNAACHIKGINLLRGSQHADTTAEIEHRAGHGTSSQLMRSVITDQAHGVFQGKVLVHKDAQKTDGTQLSNALLLSEGAEMDTKPELEIYADDVKCAHGATTGQLEDDPLFYLRSRGLSENEARLLLIQAFVDEVVDGLGDESVQQSVSAKVEQWLTEQN